MPSGDRLTRTGCSHASSTACPDDFATGRLMDARPPRRPSPAPPATVPSAVPPPALRPHLGPCALEHPPTRRTGSWSRTGPSRRQRRSPVPHDTWLEARHRRAAGPGPPTTSDDRQPAAGTGWFAPAPVRCDDYRRGYLCGMVRGDGQLLRPPHPRLPRPERGARLREGDRRQGQRARGAAARAGAAVVEGRARRDGTTPNRTSGSRGGTSSCVGSGGAAGRSQPLFHPHEVTARPA